MPIEGFPGYFVSDDGRVFSEKSGQRKALQPSWQGTRPHARLGVMLRRGGQSLKRKVHRLVLEVFVGPRPEGQVARHLDGDPTNNRLSNLSWGTQKQNIADALGHGTMLLGEKNGSARLTATQVLEIRERHAAGESMTPLMREFGIDVATISALLHGRTWQAVGGPRFAGRSDYVTLKPALVRRMRKEYAGGETQRALAARYGVNINIVTRIVRGEKYPEVGGPIIRNTRGRRAR